MGDPAEASARLTPSPDSTRAELRSVGGEDPRLQRTSDKLKLDRKCTRLSCSVRPAGSGIEHSVRHNSGAVLDGQRAAWGLSLRPLFSWFGSIMCLYLWNHFWILGIKEMQKVHLVLNQISLFSWPHPP